MNNESSNIAPATIPAHRHERHEVIDPQFRIVVDDALGIVRTGSLTILTAADADRYVVALASVLTVARRRYGRALVFADLRGSPVRSQEAADRMRSSNQSLYRPNERVALVVESSLLKLQLRRNLVPDLQEIFISDSAAITWLKAEQYDVAAQA